jgi:predicted Zn-dependent protease
MALKKDVTQILVDHLPSIPVSDLEPITEQLFKDFRFLNRKNPRIVIAASENLKEVEPWVELNFMLRVLCKERWMVTDMSSLSDFRPDNDIADAMGIGKKKGTYIFERCWVKDGEEKTERWEEEPERFHEKLIHR